LLEELFECLVKAPAQEAEELAVVLEENAQHFGDGDDVLPYRDSFEDFLLDPLGKENHPLLMTRGAEIPSFTRKRDQKLAAALAAPDTSDAVAKVATVEKLVHDVTDNRAPAAVLF
jgi:hypothetical protein